MRKIFTVQVIFILVFWCTTSHAAFVSGSTGADGAFSPTVNTVVTLPTNGILNYTTVNIPSGVTVTFQDNAANTPVYMLATGDVTINGTINVNGTNGTAIPGQGGPGGFNGGYGGTMSDLGGKGLGPGGGLPGASGCNAGGGGGFGTTGYSWCGSGGSTYGNAKLIPLIGGSGGGGGGGPSNPPISGGGGGGAILIASSGNISVNGLISANGGLGQSSAGCGSGGGIRLIANAISGTGSITAMGGYNGRGDRYGCGGAGLTRLEAYTNSNSIVANPSYSFGNPSSVFATNIPSLTVASIGGVTPPPNPTGNYNQTDILLPNTTTNPVTVNVSAANIPTGTTVKVRVIPQYGADSYVTTTLSGTNQASTASANVTLSTTYANVITAEATFTVVAMYYNGEEIDKVHVAAIMGGKSDITYITKSGKRIKGELVSRLVSSFQ